MRSDPLISLVLPVKNGLPHLERAIDAVRRQTYRNFELIVQDGGSTDGSLRFLESVLDLGAVRIESQPDSGIGQAYNRGISRASGDLLFLIACDERLDDDALQKGVDWFTQFSDAAVVYGAMRLADADGRIFQIFFPPAFEWHGVLRNEVIIPAGAAFLNRERIGHDLFYDESLKTCPDYDFWIRLGKRFGPDQIVRVPEPFVTARGDRVSQSFRAESFDQFCRDKRLILSRHATSEEMLRAGTAGILTWAAESVFNLEGASTEFLKWCTEAAKFDPHSPRLSRLASMTQAFDIDHSSHQVVPRPDLRPRTATELVDGFLSLDHVHSYGHWEGAAIERNDAVQVLTGEVPWSFAAQIPMSPEAPLKEDRWYWIRLDLQVISGQIGIGLFADSHICHERLVLPADGRTDVLVPAVPPWATAIMIRNGSLPGQSIVKIFGATVEACPK